MSLKLNCRFNAILLYEHVPFAVKHTLTLELYSQISPFPSLKLQHPKIKGGITTVSYVNVTMLWLRLKVLWISYIPHCTHHAYSKIINIFECPGIQQTKKKKKGLRSTTEPTTKKKVYLSLLNPDEQTYLFIYFFSFSHTKE